MPKRFGKTRRYDDATRAAAAKAQAPIIAKHNEYLADCVKLHNKEITDLDLIKKYGTYYLAEEDRYYPKFWEDFSLEDFGDVCPVHGSYKEQE